MSDPIDLDALERDIRERRHYTGAAAVPALVAELRAARGRIAELEIVAHDILEDEALAPDGAVVVDVSYGKLRRLRELLESEK